VGRAGDSTAAAWLTLVGSTLAALWRWRLELVLVAAPLLAWRSLSRPLGPALAGALLVVVLVAVLTPKQLRRWLWSRLRAARLRRRWRRAWLDVGLPKVAARRVWQVPAGELLRIRCSRGSSISHVAAHAERLAACLGAREVRVERDPMHAARGTALLVRRDPLDGVTTPWPLADSSGPFTLWGAIPMGVNELGGTVTMALPERNLLLGGEPGAGKSAALSLVLASAAMDPTVRLWLMDGKRVELAAWAPCAERMAGADVDEAIALLEAVQREMEDRYRDLLAAEARKITRGDGLPLHVVACDELAFYLTVEDRKKRTRFAELLRDLVARGRAAGVIVVAATQKPAADVVPSSLRDLFGFRLAMRCTTRDASDTILGQGWASLGHNAATIAPAQRGIGYLLAEDGLPVRMRAFYLDDGAVDALARRARTLRADGRPEDSRRVAA
jgi:DNA segregation ATPase FtsK/SpoIIIE-like protein